MKAYLLGALHDGSNHGNTYRIVQKEEEYVRWIADELHQMGISAWVYREGAERHLFVVEFSKSRLSEIKINSLEEKTEYIRGYFDAEGSVPLKSGARMYIYFCQKDRKDLEEVKTFLEELGIVCGKTHNPTFKEPDYWRFFIGCKSYKAFASKIGSRHPRKRKVLEKMI
ncbi:LAGLIDADG family homing endonuclease [Candidatus Micrarchaeota archaeon]|nr:LAGLIDADG family homing endonuclease [Candidatus Micrarchaeota archaeon]